MSTQSVYDHHKEAFANFDMDEMLADYSEDSVIVTNVGTYKGLDEISEMFEALFEEFSQPGVEFNVTEEIVEDDIAYFTWNADTNDHEYTFASDTFIIIDDIIRYQTVAADAIEK